eukprot:14095721-Heterocapsa_arctica.AAC.1
MLIDEEKPYVVIGASTCPPCTYGSKLQAWNYPRVDPERVEAKISEGRGQLLNSIRLYKKQIEAARYCLHEHPMGNTSWSEPEMIEFEKETPGVIRVTCPMCRWGMTATDEQGEGLVRKETCYLTNSPAIAEQLTGKCTNLTGAEEYHRHVHLVGGRAKNAEMYPPMLVEAILSGIVKQMQMDGEISNLEAGPTCEEPIFEAEGEEQIKEMEIYIDD